MTGNLVLVEGDEQARPLRGMAALRGRALDLRAPPARPLRARRRARALVHRPAPLRRGLPDRRRRPRRRASTKLGVEPLSRRVHAGGAGRRWRPGRTAPLKSFLLDQSRRRRGRQHLRRRGALPRPPAPALAGRLDEARAPARRCATRSSRRWRPGSTRGGASIDDYRDGRGEKGTMQNEFLVHTREGEPCPRCGGTIVRIVVSGRSTYFCPSCQVRLRKRPRRAGPPRVPRRLVVRQPSGPSVTVDRGRKDGEDGGGGPAQHPLRRGRPHPPPLLEDAGPGRRDRQGGAQTEARASAAASSPSSGSTSILHEGRGELLTVTNVSTVDGYPRLRASGAGAQRRRPRLRRGPAPARLGRAQPARLQPALPLPGAARRPRRRSAAAALETALSFRLKLALVAGFAPELASCARCGEAEHLSGFSGAAGGVVCASCEAGSFPLSEDAHRFMVEAHRAAAGRGARGRGAGACARSSGRCGETLEHHAHVQLRAAA